MVLTLHYQLVKEEIKMKINLDIGQTTLMNFPKIYQSSFNEKDKDSSRQLSNIEPKDRVTISPQGKKNNLLDNLMKQKMRITEQKDALVSSVLEKGGTLDTIKSQLELYEEQMKNIEEQIAEVTAKEIEQQAEKLKNKVDNKPKTEEEIKKEQISSITSLATNLQQTKAIDSIQNKMEGGIRVAKAEIKADKMRGLSGEAIDRKERNVEKMEKNIAGLNSKISDNLSDSVDKINESNKPQEILPDNENNRKDKTKESEPNEDILLSNIEDGSAEKSFEEKVAPE